jgi:reactive intermediate/imine deaminase
MYRGGVSLKSHYAIFVLALAASLAVADIVPVVPKSGPPPIGPYTPGVFAGDYLYISGQGAKAADGSMPATFEGQVRQTLENLKAVAEAAGLTLDHIVYTQVYLEDMKNFAEMNRAYQTYFSKVPPARATLGVAKLPGTPVEINAVAVRNLSDKKALSVPGYDPGEPASPGILTRDRLYVSGMRGFDFAKRAAPSDPAQQVALALDGVESVLKAAGLTMGHMVFVNPYLTKALPMGVMNREYAKRFEFGNTPARATIEVTSLPEQSQIEFTGVAVRDLSARRAVRPKNMPPSATASPCVFAGDTLYCSAKGPFIPGPNQGIVVATIEQQVRQTMRNLLDGLEEADMDFSKVVATNVYLDDIGEFQAMNKIYALFFRGVAPARTTIQQIASVDRNRRRAEGMYPGIEQISLIAVK